jgi:hypothetical protein
MGEAKRASQWRALVVDKVDEWALLNPTPKDKYPFIADLPTKIMRFRILVMPSAASTVDSDMIILARQDQAIISIG